MSYTVSAATETAVSASISTPVRPSVRTVAVISTDSAEKASTPDPGVVARLKAAGSRVVVTQEAEMGLLVTLAGGEATVEDVGICLGQAFAQCIGDKKGIVRYGDITLPMDETLMICAVDISGRAYLGYDVQIPNPKVGDFDTELAEEFFLGFVREARVTLHFKQLAGKNTHHIIEGMFKAFGRAMRKAAAIDPDFAEDVPSTKGVL